jgi:hypothetical protein
MLLSYQLPSLALAVERLVERSDDRVSQTGLPGIGVNVARRLLTPTSLCLSALSLASQKEGKKIKVLLLGVIKSFGLPGDQVNVIQHFIPRGSIYKAW